MTENPPPVRVLDPQIAEKIAAGEVIERPASVVKELVENSLDAGATEILVALDDGGKGLIEVLDNGGGMSRTDLSLCVQRHATSKIRELSDLERIATLGFRGEALPSVAAVSDLSIVSCQPNGNAHEWRAGSVNPLTFGHFLGSPHGTRIQARGLFSQVPARLKFLKAQGAEVAAVREWVERLALTHPQTGFRLVSGERVVLQLRPQTEVERIRAVLSDGDNIPIVTHEEEVEGIKYRLHWLQGSSLPQAKRLVQVVNGRALRDKVLQQALMSAFRQALLPGQYPALALFVEVNPAWIDVNVHPTKTEVRFLESGRVYRAVSKIAEKIIAEHGAPAFASGGRFGEFTAKEREAQPFQPSFLTAALSRPVSHSMPPTWGGDSIPGGPTVSAFSGASATSTEFSALNSSQFAPAESVAVTERITQPNPPPTTAPLAPKLAGIVFNTYLLFDEGDELVCIDQHAAHERVRYEALRRKIIARENAPKSSQALLLPEAIPVAEENRVELERSLPWLERFGFEAEMFGEKAVLFRGVPSEWGTAGLKQRLKNLLERLLDSPTAADGSPQDLVVDGPLFEALASQACHSSIRAGDRIDHAQGEALVKSLMECEHPWNCPHGRPTVARVPKARFEEWFQRRV